MSDKIEERWINWDDEYEQWAQLRKQLWRERKMQEEDQSYIQGLSKSGRLKVKCEVEIFDE